MFDQILSFLQALLDQTGAVNLSLGNLLMIIIGIVMIYLAIAKHYEPLLLIGIGFSCIVANVPGPPDVPGGPAISALLYSVKEGGLFHFAYMGVEKLIIPPLIFLGVGAMTDFGPMIANPRLVILGAGAGRLDQIVPATWRGGAVAGGASRADLQSLAARRGGFECIPPRGAHFQVATGRAAPA